MEQVDIAQVVIGLAIAAALAVFGALPVVQRWERRLGLSVLSAAGFPLLLLGYAFDRFGILTSTTLQDLRPAYEFGLGWIGMVVGMQMNIRRLDELPKWFMTSVSLVSIPPTLLAAAGCALVLLAIGVL